MRGSGIARRPPKNRRGGLGGITAAFAVVIYLTVCCFTHAGTGEKSADLKKEKLRLTPESVLRHLLAGNLDVKQATLDYRGTDSDLRKHRALYDTMLYGRGAYSFIGNPPENPSTVFSGKEITARSYEAGISKYFNSGTSVSFSIHGLHQRITGAAIDTGFGIIQLGGEGYQSAFMVTLSQDLLKNTFGIQDRFAEKMLGNTAEINRQQVKQRLSNLLAEALACYWSMAMAEEVLLTAKTGMESSERIRDLIARKFNLGLAEREDQTDWNSRVLQSKNLYETAGKNLYTTRLAMRRILSLDAETDFEIGQAFKMTSPDIEYERAVKDAFIKRADLIHRRILVKNAEMEYTVAEHNLMPSVKLNLSAGTLDYSPDSYTRTFNDVNRQYSVELRADYPLENTGARTRLADARLNFQKRMVELRKLEKEIRDEIDSSINECRACFKVYIRTRQAREYGRDHYHQVLLKFNQGRYGSLRVKLALDEYIGLRLQEMQSLLEYNAALLRLDLARNMVFENFGIDVEAILKKTSR